MGLLFILEWLLRRIIFSKATLNPWAGAKAQGSVNVNYFVFKAGLRLTGYLLESQFPMKVEITYNKFPLDVK